MGELEWRAAWRSGLDAAERTLLRMADRAAPGGVGTDRGVERRRALQHAADVLSLLEPDSKILAETPKPADAAMEIVRRLRVMGCHGDDAQQALRTAAGSIKLMEGRADA